MPVQLPYLVFFRSSHALGHVVDPNDIELIKTTPKELTLVGRNTATCLLLAGDDDDFREDDEFTEKVFGNRDRPDWLTFCEMLRIGYDAASAPRQDVSTKFEAWDEPIMFPQPRPSDYIRDHLNWHFRGSSSVPSFGRRMLLVCFEPGAEERELERTRHSIENSIGRGVRPVWHGDAFCAYGFRDYRKCSDIMGGLRRALGHRVVTDYLLVEVTDLVQPDHSGLSPLDQWLESLRLGSPVVC